MRRTLTALACLATLPAFAAMPPAWSEPQAPHVIYGNTYDVGSKGLTAILVTSPQGHILIDGTIANNAPLIEANIHKLGFRLEDVKLILNTHAHQDHAGAIARLAKDTGAIVRASAASANMLRLGGKDSADPQYSPDETGYAPVDAKGDIVDGSVVTLGPLRLTAHATPGHTHGGTSWTWESCEGRTCKHVAFVDSLYALASDGYRYADHPDFVAQFRTTFDRVASLPCDILVTPHPEQGEGKTCRSYADAGRKRLDEELAKEKR